MNYWLVNGICSIIAGSCLAFMAVVSFYIRSNGWGTVYTSLSVLDIFMGITELIMKPELSKTSLIIGIVAACVMVALVTTYLILFGHALFKRRNWRIDYRDVY